MKKGAEREANTGGIVPPLNTEESYEERCYKIFLCIPSHVIYVILTVYLFESDAIDIAKRLLTVGGTCKTWSKMVDEIIVRRFYAFRKRFAPLMSRFTSQKNLQLGSYEMFVNSLFIDVLSSPHFITRKKNFTKKKVHHIFSIGVHHLNKCRYQSTIKFLQYVKRHVNHWIRSLMDSLVRIKTFTSWSDGRDPNGMVTIRWTWFRLDGIQQLQGWSKSRTNQREPQNPYGKLWKNTRLRTTEN